MTKEITKAKILQEIEDKFKLREFLPTKFLFDETVVPIYNIEPHLQREERVTADATITGIGGVNFLHVPTDEQWLLHRYNVIFMTGVYTVAGVFLARTSAAHYVYLDLTAAQSVSYANDMPKVAMMNPDNWLSINVDGYTSTGTLRLIADVTKVTLR